MQIILGRRLYYEMNTGIVVYDTGERVGENIKDSTIDEDFLYCLELRNKSRENIGILQLEPGQFNEEFAEAVSYRVDSLTNELEFGYVLNRAQEGFQKPYKNKLQELEEAQADLWQLLLFGGVADV